MLQFGIKIKSSKEIIGQIPRLLVGGVKSFVGHIPVGNTGGANVPPLKTMEIPEDIQEIKKQLTDEERKTTIKFVVDKVNKRIPVIAGSGSNNTAYSIELSKYCQEVGVDGLLIVTPYYNKSTQDGLIKHYTTIANSVDLPIILYNVPGRTGVNIKPSTVEKLSKIENIVAIKEASGDISQVAEIARLCGEDFTIYSGNDDQIVPILSLGGSGVISVLANVLPKETHDIVEKYLAGDVVESRKLQLGVNELVSSLFIEVNPIPVKAAMNLMGMEAGELRLPLTNISEQNLEILRNNMMKYGIKVD